jgi:ATP phosphoribosyltransferase regulatory subunit
LQTLRERVEGKNAEGVRDLLERARAPRAVRDAVVRLTTLDGEAGVLAEARAAFAFSRPACSALGELAQAVEALQAAGLLARLTIDLGEVRGFEYYTGLVFRAYVPGLGFDVGGGGRYDALLGRFGRPMPAVGFMLGLDRLAFLLERQGASVSPEHPEAQALQGGDPGALLRRAREARAQGRRVRFAGGEAS